VLIAILLPTLSRAVQSARVVACLSTTPQISSGFFGYVSDNRGSFPVLQRSASPVLWWESYANAPLEQLLAPYVLDADREGPDKGVAGGTYLCPASPLHVDADAWSGAPGYVAPEAPMHNPEDNNYDGLSAHFFGSLRTDSRQRDSWRVYYFDQPVGVPIQWCSVEAYDPARSSTYANVGAESWHGKLGELGRPTAFLDGHAANLKDPRYAGRTNSIKLANALGGTLHSYWNRDHEAGPYGDFALSGY